MPWLDDMIDEWARLVGEQEEVGEAHSYVHMTEAQFARWQKDRPTFVAGSDEVGAGALAGPLVVCAVLAPYAWTLEGLRDSKQLKRDSSDPRLEDMTFKLYEQVRRGRVYYSLVSVSNKQIDELGIRTALRKAHCSALATVSSTARNMGKSVLLVADGDLLLPGDEVSIPKADTFIPQVMAASVIAKYTRDAYMKDMAQVYPQYGFDRHVGYGTEQHYAAIKEHGPCPLHRMSFAPFKEKSDDTSDGEDVGDAPEVGGATAQGQRSAAGVDRSVSDQREESDRPNDKPNQRRRGRKPKRGDG